MPAVRADRSFSSSTLGKDSRKLAFALLLVKSKPKSSSVRGACINALLPLGTSLIPHTAYLLKIRKALFPEMATKSLRDASDHVEDVQHYKDALEKSEQIQELLRIRNEELEQQNQNLRTQLSSKMVDLTSAQDPNNLRKAFSNDTLVHGLSAPRITLVFDELEISLPNGEGYDSDLSRSFLS